MKIGIITFHWAVNYGAVIQSYALQQCLKGLGYETQIINYIPFNVKARQILSFVKHMDVKSLTKEHKLQKFRKKQLDLSPVVFWSSNKLNKSCHQYDAYICGSDQVWNQWFVLSSESQPNTSYYLGFVRDEKKRISYATSFGSDTLASKIVDLINPELNKFISISVRENSGCRIVEEMGYECKLVVDPTLLLTRDEYVQLFGTEIIKHRYSFFPYILHENQKTVWAIANHVFSQHFKSQSDCMYCNEPISVYEWLYNIKNSKVVVTNSYHGVLFALIFHTPFVAAPVERSGMNDRILTILREVGLLDRIIDTDDASTIDKVLHDPINWDYVDEKIQQMRDHSIAYLTMALSQ